MPTKKTIITRCPNCKKTYEVDPYAVKREFFSFLKTEIENEDEQARKDKIIEDATREGRDN